MALKPVFIITLIDLITVYFDKDMEGKDKAIAVKKDLEVFYDFFAEASDGFTQMAIQIVYEYLNKRR